MERGHGLLTTRDTSPARLRQRVVRGQLNALLPGVYVRPDLAHDEVTTIRAIAARFPDAVVGGLPAARRTFWRTDRTGLIPIWNVRTRTIMAGCRFSSARVDPAQIVTIDGIRFTAPPRTALDLAVETEARSLDEVLRSGQSSLATLWETWGSSPGRPGNTAVRQLLIDSRDTPWSADERFLHRALRGRRISGWSANHPIQVGSEVVYPDVAFGAERLAVEVDGRHHRDDEATFQFDRVRQNLLTVADWRTLRYTGSHLRTDIDHALDEIELMVGRLRRRPSRNAPRVLGNGGKAGPARNPPRSW